MRRIVGMSPLPPYSYRATELYPLKKKTRFIDNRGLIQGDAGEPEVIENYSGTLLRAHHLRTVGLRTHRDTGRATYYGT